MSIDLKQLRNRPRLLHPAFDIDAGLGVMIVSFRYEVPKDGGMRNEYLRLASDTERKVQVVEGGRLTVKHRVAEFRAVNGQPAPLDEQWPAGDLVDFIEKPRCMADRALYDALRERWLRHVDFDDDGKLVVVLCWALMTYVYPLFPSVPFLHVLVSKGTGKSQLLDTLQQLCRDGYKSKLTAAAIGDMIQSRRVVPLFDQTDNLGPDLVDLVTDSYRAGARRTIVNMNDRGTPFEFETFGPKAFGGTQYLAADLADRMILVNTSPAQRNVLPVSHGRAELEKLRAACYRWALLNFHRLPTLRPFSDAAWPALRDYSGRVFDLWMPIEVMMEALEVPEDDRSAARAYYRRSQSATVAELPDHQVALLTVLAQLGGERDEWRTNSKELLAALKTGYEARGLGRALQAMNLLRARPERTPDRKFRNYIIDGRAVRTMCKRYNIDVDQVTK